MTRVTMYTIEPTRDREKALQNFFKSHPLVEPDDVMDIRFEEQAGFKIQYRATSSILPKDYKPLKDDVIIGQKDEDDD